MSRIVMSKRDPVTPLLLQKIIFEEDMFTYEQSQPGRVETVRQHYEFDGSTQTEMIADYQLRGFNFE